MSGGSAQVSLQQHLRTVTPGFMDMTRNRNIATPILILPNMY